MGYMRYLLIEADVSSANGMLVGFDLDALISQFGKDAPADDTTIPGVDKFWFTNEPAHQTLGELADALDAASSATDFKAQQMPTIGTEDLVIYVIPVAMF